MKTVTGKKLLVYYVGKAKDMPNFIEQKEKAN